jgi:hypothetical protein
MIFLANFDNLAFFFLTDIKENGKNNKSGKRPA